MTLTLMHCQPDPQRLGVWAARHGYVSRQGDLGYALHALLHAAFGDLAPKPFCYQGAEHGLLGYSSQDTDQLRQAAALARPEVAVLLGLDETVRGPGLSVRPFPVQWREGLRLDFQVRVRPIVRSGDGRERDAWLQAVERDAGAAPDGREAVYLQWLDRQLSTDGAARMLVAGMTCFQLSDVIRKTQTRPGRQTRAVCGPDAVFAGQLQVGDPAAFARLVRRGIGRHLAFGFGMLLLRPASPVSAHAC